MAEYQWRVVPLSKGQLLDVRLEDILDGGVFRKCSTYRGGGGYDRFPYICERRLGKRYSEQFVVQLFGCSLDCPYCYVTREGVWNKPVLLTTEQLVDAFKQSGQEVFHLMGGAPALYLEHWPELIRMLQMRCPGAVFHSDFLLVERAYDALLKGISSPYTLYAIDVKGVTAEEYQANTRKAFPKDRFWRNMMLLIYRGVPCYITFTNISPSNRELFWQEFEKRFLRRTTEQFRKDAFSIDLIHYEATEHVDDVPWGGRKE